MSRKCIFLCVLSFVILMSFIGVFAAGAEESTTAGGEKTYVFGVTLMSLRHPFFQEMKLAMEKAAPEMNVVLKIVDADFDAGRQSNQVNDFIQQKVDAIILNPTDSKALAPSVKRANDAGIPVITVDVAVEGADVVTHIASDNVLGGKVAGELMKSSLEKRGISEGVILIVDHSGVTSTQQRNQGFKEVMQEFFPNIKIEVMNAVGQRDKAMSVTEDAIQRFGDNLVGIFGVNDDCALGALSAVERAKRLDSISIVGYDAGEESKAAVEAGKMVGSVVQYPGKMGVMAMQVALDYITGKQTDYPDFIPIEVGAYIKGGYADISEVLNQ